MKAAGPHDLLPRLSPKLATVRRGYGAAPPVQTNEGPKTI